MKRPQTEEECRKEGGEVEEDPELTPPLKKQRKASQVGPPAKLPGLPEEDDDDNKNNKSDDSGNGNNNNNNDEVTTATATETATTATTTTTATNCKTTPEGVSGTQQDGAESCRKVCAARLPQDADKWAVWKYFDDCGTICDVHLLWDRFTWQSKCVAFVTFARPAAARRAVEKDGSDWDGCSIRVNLALDKPDGKGKQKGEKGGKKGDSKGAAQPKGKGKDKGKHKSKSKESHNEESEANSQRKEQSPAKEERQDSTTSEKLEEKEHEEVAAAQARSPEATGGSDEEHHQQLAQNSPKKVGKSAGVNVPEVQEGSQVERGARTASCGLPGSVGQRQPEATTAPDAQAVLAQVEASTAAAATTNTAAEAPTTTSTETKTTATATTNTLSSQAPESTQDTTTASTSCVAGSSDNNSSNNNDNSNNNNKSSNNTPSSSANYYSNYSSYNSRSSSSYSSSYQTPSSVYAAMSSKGGYGKGQGKGKGKGKAPTPGTFALPDLGGPPSGCPGVIIKGLSFSATEADLNALFGACGRGPSRVRILKDKEGNSKGKAFVDFDNDADGTLEAMKLNGQDLKGRPLFLEYAKPK